MREWSNRDTFGKVCRVCMPLEGSAPLLPRRGARGRFSGISAMVGIGLRVNEGAEVEFREGMHSLLDWRGKSPGLWGHRAVGAEDGRVPRDPEASFETQSGVRRDRCEPQWRPTTRVPAFGAGLDALGRKLKPIRSFLQSNHRFSQPLHQKCFTFIFGKKPRSVQGIASSLRRPAAPVPGSGGARWPAANPACSPWKQNGLRERGASASLTGMNVVSAPTYEFTVEEYQRLLETGIFHEGDRIELLNGQLIVMPPIGIRHATAVRRINNLFARR